MSTERKAWLQGIKIHPNQITTSSHYQLIKNHNFEEVEMEGRRPDGSKKRIKFLRFNQAAPGDEAEQFFKQNLKYVSFVEEVDWQPSTIFDSYGDTIAGDLKDIWDSTIADGHDWYDPAHADAETPVGFKRLVEATFIQWSKHDSPGESLATRIMGLKWRSHTDRGTYYDPEKFKRRLIALWRLCDNLPHTGQLTTDREKLKAVWEGLSDDAQLFIRQDRGLDPFDSANQGLNEIPWTDIFDQLIPFWNREFKKKSDAFVEKRKRDDDDDDNDGDDGHGRKSKRQRTSKNANRRNGRYKGNNYRHGGNRNGNGDRNEEEGSGNGQGSGSGPFNSQCKFHDHRHKYKDCVFCPTGPKFMPDKAKKFYESGRAPDWYKRAYERKMSNRNGQQQQQQQQQQYFVQAPQQQQQQQYFAALPAAVPSSQQQLPLPPAPVFTTSASAAPSAPPSHDQGLFKMQTDANGNQFFVRQL